MKSTNRKEHGSALTKLQKFLTFIGSILGIILLLVLPFIPSLQNQLLPILTLVAR